RTRDLWHGARPFLPHRQARTRPVFAYSLPCLPGTYCCNSLNAITYSSNRTEVVSIGPCRYLAMSNSALEPPGPWDQFDLLLGYAIELDSAEIAHCNVSKVLMFVPRKYRHLRDTRQCRPSGVM